MNLQERLQEKARQLALDCYLETMRDGAYNRLRFPIEIRPQWYAEFSASDVVGSPLTLGLCLGDTVSRDGSAKDFWCIAIRDPRRFAKLAAAQKAERAAHRNSGLRQKWSEPRRTPGLIYFDLERRLVREQELRNLVVALQVKLPGAIHWGVARSPVVYRAPLKAVKR